MSEEKLNIKLPTDEKLIEWLRKIHDTCYKKSSCSGCKLFKEWTNEYGKTCYISTLAGQLSQSFPYKWNMEEIERIIRL